MAAPADVRSLALLPDIDNSNTGRSNLGFGNNDRPNVTGDPARSNPTPDMWFNTAAFTMPPYGSFGNVKRNSLEGPGYGNLNLALVKLIRFGATGQLQLRAEAFNLFNSKCASCLVRDVSCTLNVADAVVVATDPLTAAALLDDAPEGVGGHAAGRACSRSS